MAHDCNISTSRSRNRHLAAIGLTGGDAVFEGLDAVEDGPAGGVCWHQVAALGGEEDDVGVLTITVLR